MVSPLPSFLRGDRLHRIRLGGSGGVTHGDLSATTPEQTIRLADHTGALGGQDPGAV